jgi:hypothetical protein
VQNYFQNIINKIRSGQASEARSLLSVLSEPNETHLGYSSDRSRGRGMGIERARSLHYKLKNSRAVTTGLVADLEETALFIENINVDVISDITTNIIRGPLIKFTQDMCRYYGIPLVERAGAKRTWNPRMRRWEAKAFDLPVGTHGPIILIPKSIVRQKSIMNADDYYRYFIVPFLQEQEINAGSSIVDLLRNGSLRVTKKSIKSKYGKSKELNLSVSIQNQNILDEYRQSKSKPEDAIGHTQIADATNTDMPDWDRLLGDVVSTPKGQADANRYHDNVEKLLTALLYPSLDYPNKETRIHEGRKRIDITYTNIAATGFFFDIPHNEGIALNLLPVECKNYEEEISNPELDQLAGRFNANRGWFGLLVCRKVENRAYITRKCKDAAEDDRGFMLVLDDEDLRQMVLEKKRDADSTAFRHLALRYNELIA